MRIIINECIEKTLEEGSKNEIEPDTLGCIVSSHLFKNDVCSPIREIVNTTLSDILNGIMMKENSLCGEPFTVTVTGVNKKGLTK
ncbi:unnamed protein product [Meloidogyne enterolobii]|uniref:Uncharacterized protein n=1 Tax=Meloidogyne enterolobii TaxID=390850 RepID=A0ACB0Y8A4_MELEN